MRKKPTISDVAQKADVSLTTVSLVLRDKGSIGAETRQRVQDAIKTVGYKRLRSVSPSPNSLSKHVILIVDDIRNPYFHELYDSIKNNLALNGFVLSIASSEDDVAKQTALLQSFIANGVKRFAVVPASGTRESDLRFVQAAGARLILAVRNIAEGHLNFIGANSMIGMMLAAEHLLALGHTEIAFVGGIRSNYAYSERFAGIAAAMVKHGLAMKSEWVVDGGATRTFGKDAAQKLLRRKSYPRAMIAYNDIVAIGFMDALAANGITPGKDFAVVGYDDIAEAAEQPVPLTTVTRSPQKFGEMLAQHLSNDAIGNDTPLSITYPPELIVRKSCGATQESRISRVS